MENGNFGHEFMKCESMPQPGNVRIASFLSISCLICTQSGLFWLFKFCQNAHFSCGLRITLRSCTPMAC
jgi:hypothetical protein